MATARSKAGGSPGLRIAVPALLAGNLPAALDAVNRSIDSPEHRRFAARLPTPT